MKAKLRFVFIAMLCVSFTHPSISQDNHPRWDKDPRTHLGLTSEGNYVELPQTDHWQTNNEPKYIVNPQGTFAISSSFRIHPRTAGTQSETPITRHPLNPNVLFTSANTYQGSNFSTGTYVSTDGGITWKGNDTLINNLGTPIFNYGDPAPVIDYTGRFLISYITLTGSIGASYSINNGTNWAPTVYFPGATAYADKNFSATDDSPSSPFFGRSYTVYTEFSGSYLNRIVLSFTTNGGVSWSSISPVSPVPPIGRFHQGTDIRCGPNGEVYIVWANIRDASPHTEDSLGFAKSTNGGQSWIINSNNVINVNGNRAEPLYNNIRVAGFPRIDVDRTCGPRAGWIYVVMGEKSPGVAGDVSDITLYKSTNEGTTWSSGIKVNQDASGFLNKRQYMGAVRVDETGAVNVIYYDTRNTFTNDSAEVYLSRSIDGGTTFTDIKISDHKFKPKPISGTASGYQGDYIGVTSGKGKIWATWMSDKSGNYQTWAASVDYSIIGLNENFSCREFPPSNMYLEFSGTSCWMKDAASAYSIGTGSAVFKSRSVSSGTVQSLQTLNFNPVSSGTYLTFDEAYAPSLSNIDSLIIETSSNQGSSYTTLARLWGGPSGGPLNTARPQDFEFISPSDSQWASKIYLLPVGTNKIKFKVRSGIGNNIFLDNICVQSLNPPVANSIGIVPEGMWLPAYPYIRMNDTVKVYLHRTDFPNIKVDSSITIISNNMSANNLLFNNALSGTYYKVVKHRNSIETWSKSGGETYIRGANTLFNFCTPVAQSYNNNQKLVSLNPYYAMFSGDVDQDYQIDGSDLLLIDNAVTNFASGYVREDLTGDSFVDGSDYAIADNNAADFITRHAPPGTEPAFISGHDNLNKKLVFENEGSRKEYELTKK